MPDLEGNVSVEVTITDGGIEMPDSLYGGQNNFVVKNTGSREHNFKLEGHGIQKEFESNLKSGETRTLRLSLVPGDYKVTCPLDDHGTPVHLQVKDPRMYGEQA